MRRRGLGADALREARQQTVDRSYRQCHTDDMTSTTAITGHELNRNFSTITISGNTFAHKDLIKAAGGTFDKDRKVWTIRLGNLTGARRREIANLTRSLTGCTFEVK